MDAYIDNPEKLKDMKARNLIEYGREEGPSYEQILKKENYSEVGVIESSTKTSEGFNMALGLDDEF